MLEQDWLSLFYFIHSYLQDKFSKRETGYFNNIIYSGEKSIMQISIDITNELYNKDFDYKNISAIYDFLENKNSGR